MKDFIPHYSKSQFFVQIFNYDKTIYPDWHTILKVKFLSKNSILTSFHEFFTQKKMDNFLGKPKLNFWTKNEDFEQCVPKLAIYGFYPSVPIFIKWTKAAAFIREIKCARVKRVLRVTKEGVKSTKCAIIISHLLDVASLVWNLILSNDHCDQSTDRSDVQLVDGSSKARALSLALKAHSYNSNLYGFLLHTIRKVKFLSKN